MTSPPVTPAPSDNVRPPNDEPHRVIVDPDSAERGYRISGMPDYTRWSTLDYAEEMAATFESQRLADLVANGENPPAPEPTPEVVHIDHVTAKDALITAAVRREPDDDADPADADRRSIHTFAGNSVALLGADWDLADALAFVDNAYVGDDGLARIAYVDDTFGHDLVVIGSDEPGGERRQISFQVNAPEGTFA